MILTLVILWRDVVVGRGVGRLPLSPGGRPPLPPAHPRPGAFLWPGPPGQTPGRLLQWGEGRGQGKL